MQLPNKAIPADERHHKVITNRRLHYLEQHTPVYFDNRALAEADPLLYDRLVRQFQTPAERQAEAGQTGWVGRMYEDLMRAEKRLEEEQHRKAVQARKLYGVEEESDDEAVTDKGNMAIFEDEVIDREQGEKQWRHLMTIRFLSGLDTDFDYDVVDFSEEWDDLKQISRDAEDAYFDEEEPRWIDQVEKDHEQEHELKGETGIQDF
ncbi:coiled-coil domain-containing protein-domain-containing protein [Lipomyces japonicus]|uniref:coiled-coil domain-containing protein-domain-containing protein n=1 Tax=Lipomyces japonicus TaxID=56871 RepID=UPI0034CEDACB